MFRPARNETTRSYGEVVVPVLLDAEERLEEPLTLEGLAATAGFSPYHFHRIFRHVTGEAPKQYLRRLRLERAVYRMKVSPDNVLQIALDSGFATHETFTRAFVRRFEISPSEFRAVLKEYRAAVDDVLGTFTYAGYADDTPLTLRFNLQKSPVEVAHTPGRHLLFVRHYGYEGLLAPRESFLTMWDELFAFADQQCIEYAPSTVIGITHDDPYVTDESRLRFDACIEVVGPVTSSHPYYYRYLPPRLCVARHHDGGVEEIAKTFAQIGVDWLPSGGYGLATASPFHIFITAPAPAGERQIQCASAYVPLDSRQGEA